MLVLLDLVRQTLLLLQTLDPTGGGVAPDKASKLIITSFVTSSHRSAPLPVLQGPPLLLDTARLLFALVLLLKLAIQIFRGNVDQDLVIVEVHIAHVVSLKVRAVVMGMTPRNTVTTLLPRCDYGVAMTSLLPRTARSLRGFGCWKASQPARSRSRFRS